MLPQDPSPLLAALACSLLVACGDAGADSASHPDTGGDFATTDVRDTSDAETEDLPPADLDVGSTVLSWEELRDSYGLITTVAGRGQVRDKGVDGWRAAFEGGPATEAELSRPHIALADGVGNILIADKDGHGIRSVAPDGTIHTLAGLDGPGDDGDTPGQATERHLSSPNGIWVLGDGSVTVYDLGNDKVRKIDPQGRMTTLFEVGGSGTGRGLWVADDESVAYVAAGAVLKQWHPGQGVTVLADGFVSLGNVHVGPGGELGVADRGAHLVYLVDRSSGELTVIAGNGRTDGGGDGALAVETGLNEVRGLWFHPRGGFFVATHKGGQVWYVDLSGTIHLFVDGDTDHTHAGDGGAYNAEGPKISEPRAVTMSPQGDVLITENDYGYVRRVALR